MNINKKLDRVKQWAGEKMGAEAKTCVSDDFKTLEAEMALRHEGMENLHKSTTVYVRSMSKRKEGDDKEKMLPVAYLGQTMMNHGEEFDHGSDFGNCLIGMGRANEKIARMQESFMAQATTGWLESLERSLAQMKEYQVARKKLDSRRLAYDASLSKMQKAKKEDFRVEEELRSQRAKYEESNEDVVRRMQDIKEAEADSIAELGMFLDAELEYYDKCRDELMRLKRDWPASQIQTQQQPRDQHRRPSRTNTLRYNAYSDPEPEQEPVRPAIRSNTRVPSYSRLAQEQPSHSPPRSTSSRPPISRAQTSQGPNSIYPTDSNASTLRNQLRPIARINTHTGDVFSDPSDESNANSASPDSSGGARSVSPATSNGSAADAPSVNGWKKAPPPLPSRAKKPPPPPPMKRAEWSVTSLKSIN